MCKNRKLLSLAMVFILAFLFTGCEKKELEEDTKSTTDVEIWTYYVGEQRAMFDTIINEFNNTVGKEKNIIVKQQNVGESHELDETLLSAVKEDAGSLDVPDMFITYRGIDDKVKKHKELLNFYDYYTDEEIDKYIKSFINMGVVHEEDGDKLYMFPLVKSQTIVMLNDTDFKDLKEKIGIDYSDLETYEDLLTAAKEYYEYTDSLTDASHDGKALFGVDSVANFFLCAVKSNGKDLLTRENGKTVANFSKESAKIIWDYYYVPMIKGYFGKKAKYATEDIKVGDLILSSGSTAGTLYFPSQKFIDDTGYDIEMKVLSIPYFEGKEKLFYIQGGGVFALKGSEEKNQACVDFLKWLTSTEINTKFAINSGYLPVTKEAFDKDYIQQYIKENEVPDYTAKTLLAAIEQYQTMKPYVHEPVEGFDSVRHVIREELSHFVKNDIRAVNDRVQNGEQYENVVAEFVSDEHFELWYKSFMDKVNATLNQNEQAK